ncbi:MAG: response regulator transcription factor [Oscillospiraceae bacterium]|nr:response regulator transcription factor [Oscillospiraceae bacterium]
MIYIVEDEENIRELVAYTLQNTGFDARGFVGGRDFFDAVRERAPDLALLDIMLPGDDGLAVLTKLRATPGAEKTPVMLLTARGSEYDKVLGFNTGADDYLTKPFGMMELVARVKNLLRRARDTAGSGEYKLGGLSVSVPRHRVAVFGETVTLTLKEFGLLECLLRNAGVVMTRDGLLSDVWGYDFEGETRTVDTHILTLRAKLGRCGTLIQTVRGVGYKIGDGK